MTKPIGLASQRLTGIGGSLDSLGAIAEHHIGPQQTLPSFSVIAVPLEACGKPRDEIRNAQRNGELNAGTLGLQSWCAVQATKPTYQAVAGLLVGLESQVPQIYKRTAPPLVEKYGFTEEEIVFFRLHIVADTEHGQRGYDLVERLADTDVKKEACLRAVREAGKMRRLYLDSLYYEYVAPQRAAAD